VGTGNGAQAALSKAIEEGAQMIVGPLSRDEVNAIYDQSGSRLPMITLNRGSKLPPAGTTSFALLPDEEGEAVANRLANRGLNTVLVFSSRSDNSQRAVQAFGETLRKHGGTVLAEIPVAGETADLAKQLDAMAKGPTAPTAVFLALEANHARVIAAQLRASELAKLPRIATSLILTGGNARADTELDGIEYPELPWLLDQSLNLPDAATLAKSLPSARGPSQRLFAFGADAWKLSAYFQRLYDDPSFSIHGNTGVLSIEVAGPVQRIPSWAVFSGGRGRASREVAGPDAQQAEH
jgi:outer membrane PBP1 activator LpoA protein